ncbi:hypothetical protein ACO0K3_03645 [Undibacterium sp. Rencai35W]|uniref:hypothetical protein n=1 Tax=Undibacterium sp. Rencai35W TaxID=3413046 RepID=UPI003BF3C10F
MTQLYANNGQSTLSASATALDTTLFIQPGHGGRFPTIAGADYFFVTLENAAGNIEVVKVTTHAANATSMIVTRGQQGTTARAWASGDLLELRTTAVELTAFETDIDDLQATRSIRAGDTYTGTHNYAGGTLRAATVSFGTTGNIVATVDYVAQAAFSASLPSQSGNGGRVLVTNGTTASWTDVPSGLPAQAGNAGRFVTTDGTTASWADVIIPPSLPSQTGNAGKFLTTNGSASSWATVPMPSWLKYAQDVKRTSTASSSTTTIDLAAGDEATFFKVTISANTTLTFTNFPAAIGGEVFTFSLMTVNDATAGRALAFGNTIKWAGGILPPRSTSANAVDIWTFFYENGSLSGSLSIVDNK